MAPAPGLAALDAVQEEVTTRSKTQRAEGACRTHNPRPRRRPTLLESPDHEAASVPARPARCPLPRPSQAGGVAPRGVRAVSPALFLFTCPPSSPSPALPNLVFKNNPPTWSGSPWLTRGRATETGLARDPSPAGRRGTSHSCRELPFVRGGVPPSETWTPAQRGSCVPRQSALGVSGGPVSVVAGGGVSFGAHGAC